MARSLNRVQLIGNLTRDPELRYTPNGTAVCSFGVATNRTWKTETGEKREEADFHNIVSWNKLAEICSQFLVKGRKVYVEGRLQTRKWTAQDGTQRSTTEIVISDMIILDSKRTEQQESEPAPAERPEAMPAQEKVSQPKADRPLEEKIEEASNVSKGEDEVKEKTPRVSKGKDKEEAAADRKSEEVVPDDIPF